MVHLWQSKEVCGTTNYMYMSYVYGRSQRERMQTEHVGEKKTPMVNMK